MHLNLKLVWSALGIAGSAMAQAATPITTFSQMPITITSEIPGARPTGCFVPPPPVDRDGNPLPPPRNPDGSIRPPPCFPYPPEPSKVIIINTFTMVPVTITPTTQPDSVQSNTVLVLSTGSLIALILSAIALILAIIAFVYYKLAHQNSKQEKKSPPIEDTVSIPYHHAPTRSTPTIVSLDEVSNPSSSGSRYPLASQAAQDYVQRMILDPMQPEVKGHYEPRVEYRLVPVKEPHLSYEESRFSFDQAAEDPFDRKKS
jgi:hypothetical protein